VQLSGCVASASLVIIAASMSRKLRQERRDEASTAPIEEAELAHDDEPSRTARKNASHELRDLGEELIKLRPERFAALVLPERLRDAVAEARRLTGFGAQRRQAQYIGKLMRKLDADSLAAVRKAVQKRQ